MLIIAMLAFTWFGKDMAQRLNLHGVTTLLVDSDHFTRGLIAQMLRGFEMDTPSVYETGAAAKAHLQHNYADLCLIEAVLPDMECSELIRWIRRQDKSPLRFVPIIVLSSYTQHRHVLLARDAGANLVIGKPVSPRGLFDRISWVARTPRPFIETANYAGPDRRFRDVPPRDGERKRETDLTEIDDTLPAVEQQPQVQPAQKKANS
ncbi:MAG TPA: response regulator [Rhizomicrobium sp.]|jgi:DNA-binding response OmpR family regulator